MLCFLIFIKRCLFKTVDHKSSSITLGFVFFLLFPPCVVTHMLTKLSKIISWHI